MIPITVGMKTALAASAGTFSTCWKVTRVDSTVLGFTDHDQVLTIDGLAYEATTGYMRTDIASADDLSVDNLEVQGMLKSPSITEADLHAGLWDFAAVTIFMVDWSDFISQPVTQVTLSGTIATVHTPLPHGLPSGEIIAVFGAVQSAYNLTGAVITVTDKTHFTYPGVLGNPASPATGTITYQTRRGKLIMRVGHLGEVTAERDVFKGELRGLTQAYSRTIGELTGPGCRAELYDARCKVNPSGFTVTGSLTGVAPNGLTLYDSARAEPGPTGGIVITNVSNANPGVVTVVDASSFSNGEGVMLSEIVGPDLLNTSTIVRGLSGNTFQLPVNTTDVLVYPPYVSGGVVTPLGSDSGYFDFGLITMTSGAANGLSMEVVSYVPGQWTLALALPYLPSLGDTYSMQAGCDKSLATCIAKFNNVLNFRGEPYLPGIDKIVQVGKQQ